MNYLVTVCAQGDQIFPGIITMVTHQLQLVYLQIGSTTAVLTAPAISIQHL